MIAKTPLETYVLDRLCEAVRRMVEESYDGVEGAAQLQAASLMLYTEFMGRVTRQSLSDPSIPEGRLAFNAFLTLMAPPYYANFLQQFETWQPTARGIYGAFRNGLLHQLQATVPTAVHIKNNTGGLLVCPVDPTEIIRKPVTHGIGRFQANGSYYFVVEQYLDDFQEACRRYFQVAASLGPGPGFSPPGTSAANPFTADSDEVPRLTS